jgi:hypothetical protein
MASFEMKVSDVFFVGGKTIFAGDLQTSANYISSMNCKLLIDGIEADQFTISGEVLSDGVHRDLWTSAIVNINQNTVKAHDVRLVGM